MRHDDDYVGRSVRLADFLVILSGFLLNITKSIETLAEEFLELAVYNANRETKISHVWEHFTADLENMEEENG